MGANSIGRISYNGRMWDANGAALDTDSAKAPAKPVRKPRRPRCEACQFARDILADTEESHRVRCTHRAVAK